MLMVVFSIFFGRLAQMPSDGMPYPVFVYSALVPWTFFANSLSGSANSLVGSAHLIGKVYFPRLLVPLASIGSWLIDFAIAGLLLLVMLLYFGIGLSWNLLAVPILTLAVAFAALGAGTLLSALTVNYRDFRYVVPFLIQFWMYITPVVYPSSLVPSNWRWVLQLNPMTGLIDGFRSAAFGNALDVSAISISMAVSLCLFLIGIAYFEKVERQFADVI
jgi:lipopolysaccharide transport system permease protein